MPRIFLIADRQGEKGFQLDRLKTAITSMEDIFNWRDGEDTIHSDSVLFQCEIHRDGVSVVTAQ